jgi:hypothetical protein
MLIIELFHILNVEYQALSGSSLESLLIQWEIEASDLACPTAYCCTVPMMYLNCSVMWHITVSLKSRNCFQT